MATKPSNLGAGDGRDRPLTEAEALRLLAKRRSRRLRCCRRCRCGDASASAGCKCAVTARVTHGEAYVYTLVSWYERHSVRDCVLPHLGDGTAVGRAGQAAVFGGSTWDAKRPIPAAFAEAEATVTLGPVATAAAAPAGCPVCYGVGYVGCRRCGRKGNVSCPSCHGGGDDSLRCLVCAGRGTVRCPACSGRVSVECVRCQGAGRIEHRRVLHARWTVTADRALLTTAGLPARLLAEAEGRLVHRQVAPRVALSEAAFPLGLVLACEVLVNRHLAEAQALADGSCRLLLQRQSVRLVPVSACEFRRSCCWSDTGAAAVCASQPPAAGAGSGGRAPTRPDHRSCRGRRQILFVYGLDRRVHWEKLPLLPCPSPASAELAANSAGHSVLACQLL